MSVQVRRPAVVPTLTGLASVGALAVSTTPDGLQPMLRSDPRTLSPISLLFNTRPSKAASTTSANNATSGTLIWGAALFNPYDLGNNPAMPEYVSYSFQDSADATQTASFIAPRNGHDTPTRAGSLYQHHGVLNCITSQVDTAGVASHRIGIALDGYPVYGGRDINGPLITTDQLDACNGISSATSEFASGV